MVKRLPAMRGTRVQSLGWEDPLEKSMATHSSILAWKIPWTEDPGRLQSMGSGRVRHNWVTSLHFSALTKYKGWYRPCSWPSRAYHPCRKTGKQIQKKDSPNGSLCATKGRGVCGSNTDPALTSCVTSSNDFTVQHLLVCEMRENNPYLLVANICYNKYLYPAQY